jgi:hypothetical protein
MTLIDNNARVILIITMAYFKIERRITCSDKKKSQVKKEKLKIHFQLQLAFVVMTNNNLKIKPCNNEYSNNDCISIEKYFLSDSNLYATYSENQYTILQRVKVVFNNKI